MNLREQCVSVNHNPCRVRRERYDRPKGALCWCNHTIWLVFLRVRVFYHYSHGLPENQSAPTAHFPSTELWSSVLFCLNESFRINLFPKSPSQTQKSAIIVACRLSSVRTHGVPYGMWAAHQNYWKC